MCVFVSAPQKKEIGWDGRVATNWNDDLLVKAHWTTEAQNQSHRGRVTSNCKEYWKDA